MSSSSGYSINRWTDGNTTVVKFSAVGALAALVLQGVVVDHVANGSNVFKTTEPSTPVGSTVLGTLAFTTSDPLACLPGGAGVSTATIQGQLAHAN
jgi:triacylglycerol esterase/lipase EstA (alpha/beta hydrolase family)